MREFKGFKKGVNLGGWLSQAFHTDSYYSSHIKTSDIEEVSSWGIDHLRVTFDYNVIQRNDGSIIEENFRHFQRLIDWCEAFKLNLVLCLHKTKGYSVNSVTGTDFYADEVRQEYFFTIWRDMARRYAKYSDRVAFELLNEVSERSFDARWNDIAGRAIEIIREYSPDINILAGGYWDSSPDFVKYLDLPKDDHVVYSFHFFEPKIFALQGAYWIVNMPGDIWINYDTPLRDYYDIGRRVFPRDSQYMVHKTYENLTEEERNAILGSGISEKYLRMLLEGAVKICDERNIPLYCCEYGVIDKAAPIDRLKWFRAVHGLFEEFKIGRAAWNYSAMDFGITEIEPEDIKQEIIRNL